MTTDPTQGEKWRAAYYAWQVSQGFPTGEHSYDVLFGQPKAFRAGYLAAQPKCPSVEEVARVIDPHAFLSKYEHAEHLDISGVAHVFADPHAFAEKTFRDLEPRRTQAEVKARLILALFESPAHDR